MLKRIHFGRDRNIVGLIYVILSFMIASISVGINVVAFPAILINNDISAFLIGLASTNEIIFGFIAAIFLSRILAKFDGIKITVVLTVIYSIILYFLFYYQNYLLWMILESIIGICWMSLYIIRQAWVNNIIADKNRGIILALITSIFCAGFITGSSLVKFLGALNHSCLIASSILVFISGIMLILIKDTFPKSIDSEHLKFKELIKKLPNETLARFLLDFQTGCLIFLGVLFGVKAGYSPENSGLLIAAFMTSGIFDLYAGFLIKFYNRYLIILCGFLGCLITSVLFIFFYDNFHILLTLFFLFGVSCAMIIVTAVTNLNDYFEKSKLIAANATFQAVGSLGTLLGCLIGGVMMQFFGIYGFFGTIIFSVISYIAYFMLFSYNKSCKKA